MKTKKIFIVLSIPIILLVVWIMTIIFTEKERVYYIPQVEIYLKTAKPPLSRYAYLFLSRDSTFAPAKESCCIKVYKSETSWTGIIMAQNNRIFVRDISNNASIIDQDNFQISKVNFQDSTLFEKDMIAGTSRYRLKPPYLEISIDGYMESVYIILPEKEHPYQITPLYRDE